MSTLPKGWTETTIGEVASYVSRGRSPKYVEHSELPVINQRCVRWTGVDEQHLKFVDPQTWGLWDDDRFVMPGDILWNSTGTGTIGRAALYAGLTSYEQAVVDSHVTIVRSGDAIEPAFLFRFIQSPNVQNLIADMQSGSTNQVELNRSEIVATEIPLPPQLEQRRIVGRLDDLTARTARARADLYRIPKLVARYKSRLLALAFSGELTAGWRESNTLPAGEQVELSKVAQSFKYGSAAKSAKEGTVPVLRMGNIRDGKLDWSNLVYTSDPKEISSYRLEAGDILFNRTNSPELVGKTALYQGEREAIYAGYLIKVKAGPRLIPTFLAYCLNSPLGRTYCWEVKTDGVSQSNINAKKLAAFRFWLPSLEEQAEIVRRIESAFGWLDRVAADHHAAAKLLPKLDAAILAKAFCGDLVPQDPSDEPAKVLLDRIRADQIGSPKKGRTGSSRRGASKMDASPKLGAPAPGLAINQSQTGRTVIKERHDPDVYGKPYLADILRKGAGPCKVEVLQSASKLRVADFYKQLAWEIDQGLVCDGDDGFEVI